MTHDELLAEIDWISSLQTEGGDSLASINASIPATLNALRAVVELHKPVQSYMFEEKACSHCSSEEDRSETLYPCPTIQAIAKELN